MQHPLFSRILSIEALHCELQKIVRVGGVQPPPHAVSSRVTYAASHAQRLGYWMDSKDPDDKED
jgi:hypothetical protein